MTKKHAGERNFDEDLQCSTWRGQQKVAFDMNDMMLQATRLTRANRLIEATALIQRMLRGEIDLRLLVSEAGRQPLMGMQKPSMKRNLPTSTRRLPLSRLISGRCAIQNIASNTFQGMDCGDGWGPHPYPRRTLCQKVGSSLKRFMPTRREAAPTSCTSPAAIKAKRFLWSSCCTGAPKRLTISPPGRA